MNDTAQPLRIWETRVETRTEPRTEVQTPGNLPPGATLDSLLTVQQFAIWIGWSRCQAAERIRSGLVPGVVRQAKAPKIHPRTFLAGQGYQFKEVVSA